MYEQNNHIVLAVYKNKLYVLIAVTSEQVAEHIYQWCNKLRKTIL